MMNTLITGFTPFDGREVNASWIAARMLAEDVGAHALEVPVRWSAPHSVLAPFCAEHHPDVIIAMGEGRQGWFDIETVARNIRQERPDNDGKLPQGEPISADGPGRYAASIDAVSLRRTLAQSGLPVRISHDAGAFLCEEMLYTLETLRRHPDGPATVVFVHLPPWGTPLSQDMVCDLELLSGFTHALYEAVMALHQSQQDSVHLIRAGESRT
ncbi:MAG TPA: hypothetical protein VJ998_03470 [Pseudomonadales bacterium]|nr:hypothetical protein [Pseudomonadales bacterium]